MSEDPAVDLHGLVADLTNASREIQGSAYAVTKKAGQNIKTQAAAAASGIGHAPHYPASIGYDMDLPSLFSVGVEIGPDKDKTQGALGNILEYGTSKNAPIPHLVPAFDGEVPAWVQALGDAATDLL